MGGKKPKILTYKFENLILLIPKLKYQMNSGESKQTESATTSPKLILKKVCSIFS